jgi:phage gp36-like protein
MHTRFTTVLVNDDQVGDIIGTTSVDELLDDGSATIDALRVGKYCLHLLLSHR